MVDTAAVTDHDVVERWENGDTRLDQVTRALDSLRSAGQGMATRAAVVNLVVLAAADAGADRAVGSIVRLGAHHPGRIIVVVPRSGGSPDRLAARVDLHQTVVEGRPLWWDVVRLEAGPRLAEHAESLVEPLLLHDLHVSLWLAGGTSRVDSEALIDLADQLVVSGERAAQASPTDVGSRLAALAGRRPLADLAWVAIDPARQALARLFDPPGRRARLTGARALRVTGPPWSSRLLAAWLVERLGLDPGSVTVSPGEDLSAELDLGDQAARLEAGPVWPAGHPTDSVHGPDGRGGEPGVATARLGDGRVVVPHGGSATPELLTRALSRPWRDRRYEAALPLAGRLGA